MLNNKQSWRPLASFLVAWSFVVLTVTGLVLYVVPHGRVAYWTHWSLAGMEKDQWAWVHMMFGGLFIVSGALHLYFNWNTFTTFLAGRVRGHLALKREVVIATGGTVAVFALSAMNLPPASWIIDLNDRIKASWVTAPELEPPFGHAEEVSLAGLARRMQLDLKPGLAALRTAGLAFDGPRDTLEAIARRNATTPMAIYAIVRQHPATSPPVAATARSGPPSVADIEAQYAGTGLGRKDLAELCRTVGVAEALSLQRLRAAGLDPRDGDTARALADRHDLSPIDLVAILLDAPDRVQRP